MRPHACQRPQAALSGICRAAHATSIPPKKMRRQDSPAGACERENQLQCFIPAISCEAKNRKKFVATSGRACLLDCAARIFANDVMPVVPSASGQTLGSETSTTTTCHHSAAWLIVEFGRMWL